MADEVVPFTHTTPDGRTYSSDPARVELPARQPGPAFGESYPIPDFVMLGIQDGLGGVILFASKELSQAQLNSVVEGYLSSCDGSHGYPVEVADKCSTMHIPVRKLNLACKMANFSMIRAETYREALRSLMMTWQPPDERKAIEP